MEEVSLSELLNLSIEPTAESSMNFGALHALLLAMLKHQDLCEIKTLWRGSSPGYGSPDAVAVSVPAEEEVQPDSELQKRTASPSAPAPDSATADQLNLLSRIQTCGDGLSKPGDSGADDQPPQSPPPPSSPPDTHTGEESQDEPDTPLVRSGPPPEDSTAAGKPNSSTPSPEAEPVLRSIGELQEKLVQLEARVATLEGAEVDQAQLAHLRELITITIDLLSTLYELEDPIS